MAAGVLAASLVSMLGCSGFQDQSRTSAMSSPVPTASPTPLPVGRDTTPMVEAPVHHRRARRHAALHPSDQGPAPSATPSPTAAAPSITLGNDEASKTRAEGLLDAANEKLNKIEPARLSRDDSATYMQAKNFVQVARQAIDEHDYTAASGLAEKAALLANKLTAGSAATPSPAAF